MYGFNPRLFSEALMRHCSNLVMGGNYQTHEPKRLLCHAYDHLQNDQCFGMTRVTLSFSFLFCS